MVTGCRATACGAANSPATGRSWTVTEATRLKESVKSPSEKIGAAAGVCNEGKNFLPGSVTIVDCITSKGKNGRGKIPAEERFEAKTLPVGADSLKVTWPPSVADTEVTPNATSATPPDTASLLEGICIPSPTSSPRDWISAWNKSDKFETFDTNWLWSEANHVTLSSVALIACSNFEKPVLESAVKPDRKSDIIDTVFECKRDAMRCSVPHKSSESFCSKVRNLLLILASKSANLASNLASSFVKKLIKTCESFYKPATPSPPAWSVATPSPIRAVTTNSADDVGTISADETCWTDEADSFSASPPEGNTAGSPDQARKPCEISDFTYPKITKIFPNQSKTTNDKNCETRVCFHNLRTHAKYTSPKTSQSDNHEIRPKKNVEKDKKNA